MTARRIVLALAGCLLVGGAGQAAYRVLAHERSELEHDSPPRTLSELASASGSTEVSARLAEVELQRGERVVFELCAEDSLDAATWRSAFDVAVFRLPQMELMLRVPLDAAHLAAVRRDAQRACLPLGGGIIDRSGRYSVDAVWPGSPPAAALRTVKLRARVLGLRALVLADRAAVVALGLGAVLLIGGLLLRHRRTASTALGSSHAVQLLGGAFAVALLVLVTHVPSAGATLTFAKGVGLVVLQAGIALLLCGIARPRAALDALDALALTPPPGRLAYWVGAALLVAALLVASARISLELVPATSEAPIQTFVRWPSGMLCFAALGVLLPLGEEVFFRGYLYRLALGFGRAAAFWLTLGLFVALHAEQSWGNWGGLVSIATAGVALTALRARSESVLIPALAHVLYNFTLSMASF